MRIHCFLAKARKSFSKTNKYEKKKITEWLSRILKYSDSFDINKEKKVVDMVISDENIPLCKK
jgi:hypothetical protein